MEVEDLCRGDLALGLLLTRSESRPRLIRLQPLTKWGHVNIQPKGEALRNPHQRIRINPCA